MTAKTTNPEQIDPVVMSERKRVWARVESAAIQHHSLTRKHGLNTLIGADAARSSQTVGDWKMQRSAIPQTVLSKLADQYGVSERFLKGHTNIESPDRDLTPVQSRARMNELVNSVLSVVNVTVSAQDVVKMCDAALHGLQEGHEEARIYGTVLMQVMASSATLSKTPSSDI